MTALRIAGIVLLVWIGGSFAALGVWVAISRWNERRYGS